MLRVTRPNVTVRELRLELESIERYAPDRRVMLLVADERAYDHKRDQLEEVSIVRLEGSVVVIE